jgi:outer membrane lipoprotein-sorting protein
LAAGLWATGSVSTPSHAAEQAAAPAPEVAEAIEEARQHLNEITTLRTRFVQVSSNGAFAEGELFLDRPGRLRFEYDPPHPALLIADGLTLLYYDRELKQATFLPLRETPLWFLLRKDVDLTDDIEVIGFERELGRTRLSLRETGSGTDGQITLTFSDQPFALHSWEILDAQGIRTQVALIDPEYGVPLDRELFRHGDLNIHFQDRRNR